MNEPLWVIAGLLAGILLVLICLVGVLADLKWYLSQLWKSLPAKEWWYETQSKIGGGR